MTKDSGAEPETIEAAIVIEISEFCEAFNCLPDEALRQPYRLMSRILVYRKHKARFEEERRKAESRKPKATPLRSKGIRGARRR